MKNILIRTLTLTLALLLCLPLAACGNAADKVVTTTAQSDPTEDKPVELDKELKIDIMVLSGTTGVAGSVGDGSEHIVSKIEFTDICPNVESYS